MGIGKIIRAQESYNLRVERIHMTFALIQAGYSIPQIATKLGVGTNTVRTYVKEIEESKPYYESKYKANQERILAQEKEKQRLKNRNPKEVFREESIKGVIGGFISLFVLWVFWWLITLIFFVASSGTKDIWNWVYSAKGSLIAFLIISILISWFRIYLFYTKKRLSTNSN